MSRFIAATFALGFFAAVALPCLAAEPPKAAEAPKEASPAKPEAPADPFAKWEKDVAAMEARDAKERVSPGGVLFYGSSSIRLWNLKESFPELGAVNHGFGGSRMVDAAHFFSRLVTPLKPRLVVLYEGDNDLASGRTPEEIAADFRDLHKQLRAALPDTKLVVISVKPSPSRWKLFEKQQQANKLVQEVVAGDKLAVVLDVTKPMLDGSGNPRGELFRDDKLHLNADGYKLWSELLAPHLK